MNGAILTITLWAGKSSGSFLHGYGKVQFLWIPLESTFSNRPRADKRKGLGKEFVGVHAYDPASASALIPERFPHDLAKTLLIIMVITEF
jgi:hypothetical protein